MALEKSKESGLSPEIGRLSAQLAKDPKSKLFIPLAEEYMKAGMPEEAVMTLEEGLKANPAYMSARVLLGKAYMEKGDSAAARGQFESVVKAIPDNLLAHKKLAEIYRDEGRYSDAIKSLRVVTILSPKDEDASKLLKELESGPPLSSVAATKKPEKTLVESHREDDASKVKTAYRPPAAAAQTAVPAPAPMPSPPPMEPEAAEMEDDEHEAPPVYEMGESEEVEAQEARELLEAQPETFAAVVPEVVEMPVPEMATLEDVRMAQPVIEAEPAPALDENPFDIAAEPLESEEEVTRPSMPKPNLGYAVDLKSKGDLNDIFASYGVPETEAAAESNQPVYEISEGVVDMAEPETAVAALVAAQVETEPVEEVEAAPAVSGPAPKEPFKTETLAEIYISQGFFDRAISIYKDLLVESPDNKDLKQKLEELYMLAGVSSAKAAAKAKEGLVAPKKVDAPPEPMPVEAEPFAAVPEADIWSKAAPLDVMPEEAEPLGAVPEVDLWSEAAPLDVMPEEAMPLEAEPFEAAKFEDMSARAPVNASPVKAAPVVAAPFVTDPAAVARLEQFLENIKRKGTR